MTLDLVLGPGIDTRTLSRPLNTLTVVSFTVVDLTVVVVVVVVDVVVVGAVVVVVDVVDSGAGVTGILLAGGVKSMSTSYSPGRNDRDDLVVNHGGSGLGVVVVLLDVSEMELCQHKVLNILSENAQH